MKSLKPQLTTLGVLLSGLTLSTSAHAEDKMFPYVAPRDCNVSVSLPNDSNKPEFSKNCHYALILPKSKGALQLSTFSPSANIMQCRAVLSHIDSINNMERVLNIESNKLIEMATKGSDDAAKDRQQARISALASSLTNMRSAYAGIEAANAQVILDGAQPESDMNEIRNLNHQLTELKGVVFARAPISEGYISFNEKNVSFEQSKADQAVLASTIPGFSQPGQKTSSVVMTGAVSGGITLSLSGACGLVTDLNYKIPSEAKVDAAKMAGLMVANYTYSVPVESGVEYLASLNVDNAIHAISTQIKTSGQFMLSELLKQNLQGSSSEICDVKVTRYELPPGDPLKTKDFEDALSGRVCEDLIKRLMARMQTKGFVDVIQKEAATAAPNQPGGNTSTIAYRRECYEDSFAGVRYASGCSDVAYTILTWHDGMSEKDLLLNDETHYSEIQRVAIGSILPRWRTMAFVPR